MAQCVEGSGDHLHSGHGHGVGRIQDGKPGSRSRHSSLDHLLLVGDDCAAAHCQDKVNVFLLCKLRSFLHFGVGRIGHDAGKICHLFARPFQDGFHLIVDAVLLHGTAAVSQHHMRAVSGHSRCQVLFCCSLSKINLCGIFIYKLLHDPLLLSLCFHYKPGPVSLEETISSGVYTQRFVSSSDLCAKRYRSDQSQTSDPSGICIAKNYLPYHTGEAATSPAAV